MGRVYHDYIVDLDLETLDYNHKIDAGEGDQIAKIFRAIAAELSERKPKLAVAFKLTIA